jgi:hypothetical protein
MPRTRSGGTGFPKKMMLKQQAKAKCLFNLKSIRFSNYRLKDGPRALRRPGRLPVEEVRYGDNL